MVRKRRGSDSGSDSGELSHEGRLYEALERAHWWLRQSKFKGSAKMVGRVRLLVMMGSDYLSGRYTRIPLTSIWALIFALLYVAGPFDLLPDVIPGMGWLDDAFVVGLVFAAISRDLCRYCKANDLDPKSFGM